MKFSSCTWYHIQVSNNRFCDQDKYSTALLGESTHSPEGFRSDLLHASSQNSSMPLFRLSIADLSLSCFHISGFMTQYPSSRDSSIGIFVNFPTNVSIVRFAGTSVGRGWRLLWSRPFIYSARACWVTAVLSDMMHALNNAASTSNAFCNHARRCVWRNAVRVISILS